MPLDANQLSFSLIAGQWAAYCLTRTIVPVLKNFFSHSGKKSDHVEKSNTVIQKTDTTVSLPNGACSSYSTDCEYNYRPIPYARLFYIISHRWIVLTRYVYLSTTRLCM